MVKSKKNFGLCSLKNYKYCTPFIIFLNSHLKYVFTLLIRTERLSGSYLKIIYN